MLTLLRVLFLYLILLTTYPCFAKNIIVFAPHHDDEVLMTAGVIHRAVNDGDHIKVVIVANGDILGKQQGYIALQESINGLATLGLNSKDIYFLGYRDVTILTLYNNPNENAVIYLIGKEEQWEHSYGLPDKSDYFTDKLGQPALLNKKNLRWAIESILKEELPEIIYTTAYIGEAHCDHRGVNRFVVDAIVSVKRQIPSWSPKLYNAIVHSLGGDTKWPVRDLDVNQVVPFTMPVLLEDEIPRLWSDAQHIPVPIDMLKTPRNDPAVNLKYKAIHCHTSKVSEYHYSFVKSDEVFWVRDFSNIALLSTVTVSSENTSTTQLGIKAVDGQRDVSYDAERYTKEWVTNSETRGSWIQLNWSQSYLVNKIVLYDRVNLDDWITGGTLYFSDGTSMKVGTLSNKGSKTPIVFPPKRISWVKFVIDNCNGSDIGLAEFEVYPASVAREPSLQKKSKPVKQRIK